MPYSRSIPLAASWASGSTQPVSLGISLLHLIRSFTGPAERLSRKPASYDEPFFSGQRSLTLLSHPPQDWNPLTSAQIPEDAFDQRIAKGCIDRTQIVIVAALTGQ